MICYLFPCTHTQHGDAHEVELGFELVLFSLLYLCYLLSFSSGFSSGYKGCKVIIIASFLYVFLFMNEMN